MKKLMMLSALFLALPAQAADPTSPPVHKIIKSDQVAWTAGPASLAPGARAAVLYGDPAKEGLFIMRLWLPAGFKIAPHTHPRPEIVTVITGTFHIGMGTTADAAKAEKLSPGGFFAFDPGLVHFAHVEEDTVVQISSNGPWGINYVNPTDDPR